MDTPRKARLIVGILLVLFALVAMPALDSAANKVTKESVKQVCSEDGGDFEEYEDEDGGDVYQCAFDDGEILICDETISDIAGTEGCWWKESGKRGGFNVTGHAHAADVRQTVAEAQSSDQTTTCAKSTSAKRGRTGVAVACAGSTQNVVVR